MKRLLSYSLLLITFLLYAGCKSNGEHILSDKIGPWKNIYQGDAGLAGISIEQYPTEIDSEAGEKWRDSYKNRHPNIIIYYFWNGAGRELEYNPNGKIRTDFWYKTKLKAGDMVWDGVNFKYGSDPAFKTHKDPRLSAKIGLWTNIYQNDPSLAGVAVQQYPDQSDDSAATLKWRKAFVYKHPAIIQFVFWNGNMRKIEFDPSGKVLDDSSYSDFELAPESPFWNEVDFSYGSDPSFKKHKDPRPKNHS